MATEQVLNPMFDLFSKSLEDNSIESFEMLKFETKQAINANTTIYKLDVDDLDSWYLLNKGYLELRFKLAGRGGGDLAEAQITTLVSNALQIFKKANLKIGGLTVEESLDIGYASLVEGFVSMNKEYAESIADSQWYYPEKAHYRYGAANDQNTDIPVIRGGGAEVRPYIVAANVLANEKASANVSFQRRFNRTSNASECQIFIPLARIFGFCRDYKAVLRGQKLEFQFDKNTAYDTVIHSAAGQDLARVDINEITLWLPRVKPSALALKALEQMMGPQTPPAKILYHNWSAYLSSPYDQIAQNAQQSIVWRLPPIYGRPVKAFVGVQGNNKYTGQLDLGDINGANNDNKNVGQNAVSNPLTFVGGGVGQFGYDTPISNINNMYLRINGQHYPQERYDLAFNSAVKGDLYGRAYSEFLRVCEKLPFGDEASIVDHDTYKYVYPLIAFDLESSVSGFKEGDTTEIEVNTDLVGPVTVTDNNNQAYRLVMVLCTEQSKIITPSGDRITIA